MSVCLIASTRDTYLGQHKAGLTFKLEVDLCVGGRTSDQGSAIMDLSGVIKFYMECIGLMFLTHV